MILVRWTEHADPLELEAVGWVEDAFRASLERVVDRPRGVARVPSPAGWDVCLKLGRGARWLRLARGLTGGPCRSARALAVAQRLCATADCRTPIPRALILDVRLAGWVAADAYVSDWVDGETLDVQLARLGRVADDAVAAAVAGMHAAAVAHRDLKASNLLIERGTGSVHVLDLDGARPLGRRPSARRRARDIARLALSYRVQGLDPAPLIERYGTFARLNAADMRRLARRVDARVERWVRRSRRELR